jgi:hypothetical protein
MMGDINERHIVQEKAVVHLCACGLVASDTELKDVTFRNSADMDSVLLYEIIRQFIRPGVFRTNQEKVAPHFVTNLIYTRHILCR